MPQNSTPTTVIPSQQGENEAVISRKEEPAVSFSRRAAIPRYSQISRLQKLK